MACSRRPVHAADQRPQVPSSRRTHSAISLSWPGRSSKPGSLTAMPSSSAGGAEVNRARNASPASAPPHSVAPARMRLQEWQGALGRLAEPGACFMYAETDWWRCPSEAHRRAAGRARLRRRPSVTSRGTATPFGARGGRRAKESCCSAGSWSREPTGERADGPGATPNHHPRLILRGKDAAKVDRGVTKVCQTSADGMPRPSVSFTTLRAAKRFERHGGGA